MGPTNNRKTVLQNCQENVRGGWFGLTDSPAENAVEKATDTWWPGGAGVRGTSELHSVNTAVCVGVALLIAASGGLHPSQPPPHP